MAPKVNKQQEQQAKPKKKKVQEEAKPGFTHYTSYLQVLATDNSFTSPSVLLVFDKTRYLFNSGEGIQRMFRECKLRISKVDDYLFTRVSTECLGGLPGMLLSTVPAGNAGGLLGQQIKYNIHGPDGIAGYVDSFRSYVTQETGYAVKEFASTSEAAPILQSKLLTITPVLIQLRSPAAAAAASAAAGGGEASGEGLKRKAEDPATAGAQAEAKQPKLEGAAAAKSAPQSPPRSVRQANGDDGPMAVAYVCELAGRPGKFSPEKARELGVPKGMLFGQLARGEAVQGAGGRMVQPSDVIGPGVVGPLVVVVDIPTERHLTAAMEQAPFARWHLDEAAPSGSSDEAAPPRHRVMVHLGPAALLQGAAYGKWLAALGKGGAGWQHLLVSSGVSQPSPIQRANALQAHLNCLSDAVFPLLSSHQRPRIDSGADLQASLGADLARRQGAAAGAALAASLLDPPAAAAAGPSTPAAAASGTAAAAAGGTGTTTVTVAPSLLKFNLTGSAKLVSGLHADQLTNEGGGVSVEAAQAEFRSRHAGLVAEAAAAAAAPPGPDLPAVLQGVSRETAELVFLGTASSQPGRFRNVTASYLDLFAVGGVLVDCGEDTLGQLVRRYGEAGALQRMLALPVVWISHMHADHHNGLARLLELRRTHLGPHCPPLLIIGPMPLFRVLNSFAQVLSLSYRFLPNQFFHHDHTQAPRPPPAAVMAAYEEVKAVLRLRHLEPFPVAHVAHSSGLVVEGLAGWRIVFSADTRPCDQVVHAARGATLLVHEATFEDDMAQEALVKRHSTTSEALGVARQAGVYRTVLTHFSTRYPTLPRMPPSDSLAVAMDFMRCNLADLHWLPRLVAPLGALFEAQAKGWQDDAEEAEGAKDEDEDEA